MKVVKPVLFLQHPTFHRTTCICGLSTGLYLTESSIQTKSGTAGENDLKLQYISLLTEALSPYKQELYSSTIRVCKGSREPREMTNGNKGLRENERRINGGNKKTCARVEGRNDGGYMSAGLGQAVSRCDGQELSTEKRVVPNDRLTSSHKGVRVDAD